MEREQELDDALADSMMERWAREADELLGTTPPAPGLEDAPPEPAA